MAKHTVSMYFVNAAVSHLSPDSMQRALTAAGIPASLVKQPAARVPATAYSALWVAVARELDDEFFGLDSRRMKVGSFALVCQAVLSCTDIEHALKRTLRGFGLLLDDMEGSLRIDDGRAVVSVTNRIGSASDRRFADETYLTLVHGLICWLAGRRVPLSRVGFQHARPSYAAEYSRMYCDSLAYEMPRTAMEFDARVLKMPIAQDAAALQRFLRSAPQSVFLKYINQNSWEVRVRRRLHASVSDPGAWPVFEDLAAEWDVTPATLRRRLEAEGTSYQAIKDRLRSDVAINHLCNSNLSMDAIATSIGFQDASAFHRAFKRWNGIQPGEYRRRQSVE